MIRRLAGRPRDEGMGMILVIGYIVIISTLVAVAGAIATNSLRTSRQRVTFEQALATAETGVDMALAHLQRAFDDYNIDYPIPTTPSTKIPTPLCNAPAVIDPGPWTTEAAEKAWARSQLNSLAASHPECIRQTGEGEYLIFKPQTPLVNGLYPKYGKVYSIGWVPSRANPEKTRLVKSEYIFMPYRPTHAVLASGSISLSSSTTVTAAFGVDPTLASVHTNGSLSTVGNPTVTGMVSSTGPSSAQSNNFNQAVNPSGQVQTQPTQRIPTVSAVSLYFRALADHPELSANWFDLCSDGTVRPQSANGPCTATNVLNSGSPTFRGWSYDSGSETWIASNVTQDGIYFADKSNVDVGPGNGSINNITVIASAENPDNCSAKKNGNITWDHFALLHPAYPNLWMYADSDIVTHSNFTAGSGTTSAPVVSGMFVAGDQIHMETSSQGAVGSVVVADKCNAGNPDLVTSSEIKNPSIYYDPNSDAPFTSVINTTLWIEYTG